MKLKVLGIIVIVFIAIQLIPYGREHTNPAVINEPAWDSPQTRETFYRLCGDCHSNETEYPFYSNIAPVSWLVQSDVNEGREHFNVSTWSDDKAHQGKEAIEEYEEGEMPLWIYTLPRPETNLSEQDRADFLAGLRATFKMPVTYKGKINENNEHDD